MEKREFNHGQGNEWHRSRQVYPGFVEGFHSWPGWGLSFAKAERSLHSQRKNKEVLAFPSVHAHIFLAPDFSEVGKPLILQLLYPLFCIQSKIRNGRKSEMLTCAHGKG